MQDLISPSSLADFALSFNDQSPMNQSSSFWGTYLSAGSSLWLDTGDIEEAKSLWSDEFSAMTTNNTLLNKEVQKGVYDSLIPKFSKTLNGLIDDEKVKEVAFCLNAIHGLRLVNTFNCMVSVELHTDLTHDIEGIFETGKRLFAVCPKRFIIKVPFTAAGLLGARKLHDAGIPVNFTLDFSVRQNAFAAVIAKPKYSNVFLGRLGAYFKNNELGEGLYIGEKVTKETQHYFRNLNKLGYSDTKLIAASLRNADQLLHLVGTDTFTIPTGVAHNAVDQLISPDKSHINDIPEPVFYDESTPKKLRLKHLWRTQEHEKSTIMHLNEKLPATANELENYANEQGCHDIFPLLSTDELQTLDKDGKIPVHAKWEDKIKNFEIGIDTLLTQAGLFAFINDQKQLDDRIASML